MPSVIVNFLLTSGYNCGDACLSEDGGAPSGAEAVEDHRPLIVRIGDKVATSVTYSAVY